jgi:predicted small secreted protein
MRAYTVRIKGIFERHILKYLKYFAIAASVVVLSACGTVGGAVSGAGQDLTKAGEWIRNR